MLNPPSGPSPILDTHEKESKNESTIGIPNAANTIPPTEMTITYIHRKAITLFTISDDTTLPLTLTDVMALGWTDRYNSLRVFLSRKIRRSIFAPPLVEPAHAPKNMRTNNNDMTNGVNDTTNGSLTSDNNTKSSTNWAAIIIALIVAAAIIIIIVAMIPKRRNHV